MYHQLIIENKQGHFSGGFGKLYQSPVITAISFDSHAVPLQCSNILPYGVI